MINKELVEYVRIQRTNGLSKEAITQALAAGGWSVGDVNEAFMAIDGITVAPPPPPPPSQPMPMQPRTILPPTGGVPPTLTPIGNVTITPTVSTPVMAASEFTTTSVKRGRGRLFITLLVVCFLAIVGGGVYVALFNPSLINSFIHVEDFFPPPTPEDPFLDTTTDPSIVPDVGDTTAPIITSTTTTSGTASSTSQ